MYCKDFYFDGHCLSDFNCVIGVLGGAGIETVSIGNELSLVTVRNAQTYRFKYVSSQYETAYTCTFSIFKYNCDDYSDHKLSEQEVAGLMRWLNRKGFYEFRKIDDDEEVTDIYYMATFTNIQKIVDGDDVIGLELTMQTNAPFAYYNKVKWEGTFSGDNTLLFTDTSDEIGYLYPTIEVECLENGNFSLTNSQSEKSTLVRNCVNGEVLTFAGDTKQLYSSVEHEGLYNDFNFVYPVIGNTFDNRVNELSSNLKCNIRVEYSPICKAVL